MTRFAKVIVGLSLVLLVSALTGLSAVAATATSVGVLVNGKKVTFDVPPIIIEGRTMIPVRKVAELLGATVEWDPVARAVTVYNGDSVARLWIDSAVAEIDGFTFRMDVPATIVSGRTVVPLRFLAEMLQFLVEWDDVTRMVHLVSPDGILPTRIALRTSSSDIRVGDTVTVDVRLEGARSAYTTVVNLDFDRGLQAKAIIGGSIIEGLLFQNRMDNTKRRIDYAVSRVGQVRGFSGDGVLYSVSFVATEAGEVRIMPTLDSMIVDTGLEALQVVRNSLWLTIRP